MQIRVKNEGVSQNISKLEFNTQYLQKKYRERTEKGPNSIQKGQLGLNLPPF